MKTDAALNSEKQEDIAVETPFLRVWKARELDSTSQEVAEYLGCGCTLSAIQS